MTVTGPPACFDRRVQVNRGRPVPSDQVIQNSGEGAQAAHVIGMTFRRSGDGLSGGLNRFIQVSRIPAAPEPSLQGDHLG